jgi:hypothetical protein
MKIYAATLLVLFGSASAASAEDSSWRLKVEGGTEYDTNVFRFEAGEESGAPIEEAAVFRFGAKLRLAKKLDKRSSFRGSLLTNLKVVGEENAASENVGVTSGDASLAHVLSGRDVMLSANVSLYNAFDYDGGRDNGRNFGYGAGEAAVTMLGPNDHRLTVSAGYRLFDFKPNRDFDWQGDTYGLSYRKTWWLGDSENSDENELSSIEAVVGYRLERRGFEGPARTNTCGAGEPLQATCSIGTLMDRSDLFHTGSVEVSYTGERIYSGRYEFQINDSNSFGESLVRQRIELGITSELFAEVYLTAKAAILYNIFLDSLLVTPDEFNSQTFVSIDDENRNSLSLHLTRKLRDKLAVEARYAIFSNEFADSELTFRRQTAYLGLTYLFDG